MFKKSQNIVKFFLGLLFLVSLTITLWLHNPPAFSKTEDNLLQTGVEQYRQGEYLKAISSWKQALSIYEGNKNAKNAAIAQENIALGYEQLGESDEAIAYWQKTITYHQQAGDSSRVGKLLVQLAQSYNNIGKAPEAFKVLCGNEAECLPNSALNIARTSKDKATEAAALGVLGDTYRAKGNYQKAIVFLEESLKISSSLDNAVYRISGLNSLGNIYIKRAKINYYRGELARSRKDEQENQKFVEQAKKYDALALEHWQSSLEIASKVNDLSQQKANILVNMLEPLYRQKDPKYEETLEQAYKLVANLPDSRDKIYRTIDLANLVQPDSFIDPRATNYQCLEQKPTEKKEALLKQAEKIAKNIQDKRAESFAKGNLGHLYECTQQNDQALSLTQQAIILADQNLKNKDSLYLWEWQLGRILKAENQPEEAIKAYERSLKIVQDIRSDLLAATRELQLDFRSNIEPIYRQLASLKLQNTLIASEGEVNLSQALNTIDSLKIAELENYLGNDCILTSANKNNLDVAGKYKNTAIVNTIIFPKYTAIIVVFPSGEKKYYTVNVAQETLIEKINQFRQGLERFRDFSYEKTQAIELYGLLLAPFIKDLEAASIKNIVFINDGILRTVPMGALHDGKKFLIESYAVSTTPSLSLTKIEENAKTRQALALGVTKEVTIDGKIFPALINVKEEINEIQNKIPNSKSLIDENFSSTSLEQELGQSPYNVIHIATHGQFSSEPENTFLVTGDNRKLTMNNLEKAIRTISQESDYIDLLVLTACQTAVGDDRAALGLAGVAVQSGAKSVLASLWFIQDSSTVELVNNFYSHWQSGLSKSEALQLAQKEMLSKGDIYSHPAYWAPFVMIGNWF